MAIELQEMPSASSQPSGNNVITRSIYAGSFFLHMHLHPKDVLALMYFWSQRLHFDEFIIAQVGIARQTASDYKSFFRELTTQHFEAV